MKRLIYLSILPEVEVELVHILAYPFWNRLHSYCFSVLGVATCTHGLSLHLSLAVLTWRIGN